MAQLRPDVPQMAGHEAAAIVPETPPTAPPTSKVVVPVESKSVLPAVLIMSKTETALAPPSHVPGIQLVDLNRGSAKSVVSDLSPSLPRKHHAFSRSALGMLLGMSFGVIVVLVALVVWRNAALRNYTATDTVVMCWVLAYHRTGNSTLLSDRACASCTWTTGTAFRCVSTSDVDVIVATGVLFRRKRPRKAQNLVISSNFSSVIVGDVALPRLTTGSTSSPVSGYSDLWHVAVL
jgi:hypothetical protein